jgi:hypothetical protein
MVSLFGRLGLYMRTSAEYYPDTETEKEIPVKKFTAIVEREKKPFPVLVMAVEHL